MAHRCFSEESIRADDITLQGSEAHHLLHVLRAAPGMRVTLFDGSGLEADAVVQSCQRSAVRLSILERRDVDREAPLSLTLGVSLPKGDRQRWLIEKLVELGVARLVPLVTERGVATSEKHAGDKLARYVIEASKQCGRNRLMEIAQPLAWNRWIEQPDAGDAAPVGGQARRWVAHPGQRQLRGEDLTGERPTFIAVGPEGGLTEAEIAAAVAAGWEAVGLGPRILRIETAAIALAAALTATRTDH